MRNIIRLLGIAFFIFMSGNSISAQNKSNASSVKITLMTGKKQLEKGDTLAAIKSFEKVLALDSFQETAISLLGKLHKEYSGFSQKALAEEETEEQKTEVVKEEKPINAEVKEVKEEVKEVVESVIEKNVDTTIELDSTAPPPPQQQQTSANSNDPFANVFGHKPNKAKTNTDTDGTGNVINTAGTADGVTTNPLPVEKCNHCGKPLNICLYKGRHPKCTNCGKYLDECEFKGNHSNNKREDVKGSEEMPTQDAVLAAIRNAHDPQLFGFSHLPVSPLYFKAKLAADAKPSGRWASSVRNFNFGNREMIDFVIDPAVNSVTWDEPSCDIIETCKTNGYTYKIGDNFISNGKLKLSVSIQCEKTMREDVEAFVNALLVPYLGQIHIGNYNDYVWMKEGDIVTDTVINSHAIRDTVSIETEGYAMIDKNTFVLDSVVYDTTYVMNRIRPTQFSIDLQMSVELSLSDKIMPGTMSIKGNVISKRRECALVDVNLPLTFVRMPDAYEPDYSNGNFADLRNEKPQDYLAKIDKLAKGRASRDADALRESADILFDYPQGRTDEAYSWLKELKNKYNDTKAMIILADAKAKGIGGLKNLNEAKEILTTASSLLDEDAGYYLSLILLEQGESTQAYTEVLSSAKGGAARSKLMVAEMFITGNLVRMDERKALPWIKSLFLKPTAEQE